MSSCHHVIMSSCHHVIMSSYCCLFVCLFSGPATDDKHCFDCLFVVSTINGMEWNRLAGTGVATAQKIVQRPTPFLSRLTLRGWEGLLQWTISPTITCIQTSTHRPERPYYWKRNRNAKEVLKSSWHQPNRDLVFRKIKEASCSANSVHYSLSVNWGNMT